MIGIEIIVFAAVTTGSAQGQTSSGATRSSDEAAFAVVKNIVSSVGLPLNSNMKKKAVLAGSNGKQPYWKVHFGPYFAHVDARKRQLMYWIHAKADMRHHNQEFRDAPLLIKTERQAVSRVLELARELGLKVSSAGWTISKLNPGKYEPRLTFFTATSTTPAGDKLHQVNVDRVNGQLLLLSYSPAVRGVRKFVAYSLSSSDVDPSLIFSPSAGEIGERMQSGRRALYHRNGALQTMNKIADRAGIVLPK